MNLEAKGAIGQGQGLLNYPGYRPPTQEDEARALRYRALDMAITASHRSGLTPNAEDLVKSAKAFETYLKGE
jgi:hypothetical protein